MKKLTILMKLALLITVVYFYIDFVYIILFHVNFIDILFWWSAHFAFSDVFNVLIPVCVGGFVVLVLAITINEQYIQLFGKKVELIYLGDKMPFIEVYYSPSDKKKREIEYIAANKNMPNLSLRNVFKKVLFLQDPLQGRSAIYSLESYNPNAVKFLTGLSILLGLVGLLVLVIFTKPFVDAHNELYPLYWGHELSKFIELLLTRPETWAVVGWSIIALIGVASLSLYRFRKMELIKEELELNQPLQLPRQYYAGQTFTSEVVEIEPDMEENNGNVNLFHNNNSNIDGRFVTIKLLQYLEHPAYVSFYFSKKDQVAWEEKLGNLKIKEQPLLVDLDEAYRVAPAVALGL